MLLSLYNDVKVITEGWEENKKLIKDDNIEIFVRSENVNGINDYVVNFFDSKEDHFGSFVWNLCYYFHADLNEFVVWRYSVLCQSFSSIEMLNSLFFTIPMMNVRNSAFSYNALLHVIVNSFDIQNKLIEVPHFMSIVSVCKQGKLFMFSSIYAAAKFLHFSANVMENNEVISVISSLLKNSMYYVCKFDLDDISYFRIVCQNCYIIALIISKMPSKFQDLGRSILNNSGWTEWLIRIFNALNPFSKSPCLKSLPSPLSFLLSAPPSENLADVVKFSAAAVKIICKEDTPNNVKEYLELVSFI
jgi:hypothetical protein